MCTAQNGRHLQVPGLLFSDDDDEDFFNQAPDEFRPRAKTYNEDNREKVAKVRAAAAHRRSSVPHVLAAPVIERLQHQNHAGSRVVMVRSAHGSEDEQSESESEQEQEEGEVGERESLSDGSNESVGQEPCAHAWEVPEQELQKPSKVKHGLMYKLAQQGRRLFRRRRDGSPCHQEQTKVVQLKHRD